MAKTNMCTVRLGAILKGIADVIVSKPNGKISSAWQKSVQGVLDAYLGQVPEKFIYKGKEYTPQSYMESLGITPDNYVGLTSFTHHPFYKPFALEIPDNWINYEYYNLPLDEAQGCDRQRRGEWLPNSMGG